MTAKKSVLMCCYYFPPFARSGGMRSMQFGKRLAAMGWDVEVLTADPGLYSSSVDPASTAKGYEGLDWAKVTHVPCPREDGDEPSRWRDFLATLWDPWRFEGRVIRRWVREATKVAEAIVRKRPETVLYIGMQPYIAARIGLDLQRRLGTRWLADLADPWTLDEVCQFSSRLHFERQQGIFRRVLRNADSVIGNTPDASAALAAFEPRVAERLATITFGYDRDNLPPPQPPPVLSAATPFQLVHLGAIEVTGAASNRKNPLRYRRYTTDIAARGTHYLLAALELVRQRRPELFAKLRIRVVSTRTDNEFAAVRDRGMAAQFEWTGMLANAAALAEVGRAHAALVLQQGAPAGHRLRTVRAKSYEYMALGKPVLGCVPEGDGADFLARYGRGILCNPSNAEAIASGLIDLHARYAAIAAAPIDQPFVESFEWGALARQLDAALSRLAN